MCSGGIYCENIVLLLVVVEVCLGQRTIMAKKWVNSRKMMIIMDFMAIYSCPFCGNLYEKNTKNSHRLKYVTNEKGKRKIWPKKYCQSTWNGAEQKMCSAIERIATVSYSHSWIRNRLLFFRLLLLACIGFLGRQQLLDDDVFIYESFSLLVLVFHPTFFHLSHFSTQNIIFFFSLTKTNWQPSL